MISFTRPPVEFGKSHNPLKRIKSLLRCIYFWQHRACNNSANGVILIACALHKKNWRTFRKLLDTFCCLAFKATKVLFNFIIKEFTQKFTKTWEFSLFGPVSMLMESTFSQSTKSSWSFPVKQPFSILLNNWSKQRRANSVSMLTCEPNNSFKSLKAPGLAAKVKSLVLQRL